MGDVSSVPTFLPLAAIIDKLFSIVKDFTRRDHMAVVGLLRALRSPEGSYGLPEAYITVFDPSPSMTGGRHSRGESQFILSEVEERKQFLVYLGSQTLHYLRRIVLFYSKIKNLLEPSDALPDFWNEEPDPFLKAGGQHAVEISSTED